MKDQLDQSLKQQLFDKLHNVISSELNKMEIKYVEHKEALIIGESEFKGLKIIIKVEVK